MTINPLEPFEDNLIGDTEPYHTLFYRDVPSEYRITALSVDSAKYPNLAAAKNSLDELAETYFKDYEIVGNTVQQFHDHIRLALASRAEVYENFLASNLRNPKKTVITKLTRGTYDKTTGTNKNETHNIDVPLDDPDNDQDTTRVESTQTPDLKLEHLGSDVSEVEDDDFNTLAEYIRNSPQMVQEYIKIFNDCFMLKAAWKW